MQPPPFQNRQRLQQLLVLEHRLSQSRLEQSHWGRSKRSPRRRRPPRRRTGPPTCRRRRRKRDAIYGAWRRAKSLVGLKKELDAAAACCATASASCWAQGLPVRETDGRGGGAGRRASRISNPIARGWLLLRAARQQRRGKNYASGIRALASSNRGNYRGSAPAVGLKRRV